MSQQEQHLEDARVLVFPSTPRRENLSFEPTPDGPLVLRVCSLPCRGRCILAAYLAAPPHLPGEPRFCPDTHLLSAAGEVGPNS